MKINSCWNNSCKGVKKKLQQGLSLIEAAMVLALSAVVVAGVMAYYQSASTNEKTERTITEIMAVIASVNSIYSSAPDFSGLSSTVIAKSGFFPSSFVYKKDDGQLSIMAPYGDDIVVSDGTSFNKKIENENAYYHIGVFAPRDVCANLARLDLGSSLVAVNIAGRLFMGNLPTIKEAQEACSQQVAYDDEKHVEISYTLH
ncbi:type 4 pilus major pilin [Serratia sp. UGAL515B_01]|uniref:type 4 pilus major pilin n=1 Tax=Serratia sp. UGAL515B_01 TaxID=2986763 RepID=UPI002955AAF1|nr:type 4 pilus major pilin [Serratia sp. UGAL515B_01]WON76971.1 pilus assembly protein [Serratia sp. UGAL515B_01]